MIYVIEAIINYAPGILVGPLLYIFKRQQNYSKLTDQHTIILENHDEKFDKLCVKLGSTVDQLGETNIRLAELTGILKEMHNHHPN